MKYSEDRIKSLALKIHDALYHDSLVNYTDDEKSLKVIKEVMLHYFDVGDEIDTLVQKKLQTTKRNLIPGTSEWQILYDKYYAEEAIKRGL